MKQYYTGRDGQRLGPFEEERVREMLASGELRASDLVWCEGMTDWQPAGRVFSSGDPSNPYQPSAAVMDSSAVQGAPDARLADPLTRLVAVILDGLIAMLLIIPLVLTMDRETGEYSVLGWVITGVLGLALIVVNVFMLTTRGQTIAKRLMKIRIVRFEDGRNPGFVKAVLLRSFVPGLLGNIPGAGPVFSLVDALFIFRADRRCVHDLMAGTKVVKVDKTAA